MYHDFQSLHRFAPHNGCLTVCCFLYSLNALLSFALISGGLTASGPFFPLPYPQSLLGFFLGFLLPLLLSLVIKAPFRTFPPEPLLRLCLYTAAFYNIASTAILAFHLSYSACLFL